MAALATMNAALRGVTTVYLDTAVFIDYGDAAPRSIRPLTTLFDSIRAGEIIAVTSFITFPELLNLDEADAQQAVALASYEKLLALTRRVPLSEDIAREAAKLRFIYRLETPDSVHVATASREGGQALITADAADCRFRAAQAIHGLSSRNASHVSGWVIGWLGDWGNRRGTSPHPYNGNHPITQ